MTSGGQPDLGLDIEREEEPGAEDELDLETLAPRDFQQLRVTAVDWTVGTLLDQIEMNELDIAPSFQRRDAWNDRKKSRLIESLILGIPVPQIILADLPGRNRSRQTMHGWTVLDGKQRLLAVAAFVRPALVKSSPLKLRGLVVMEQLNGLTYGDLQDDPEMRESLFALRTRTLRTVLVEHAADDRVLHMIFLRLNTETVKLSPQELRQAEYPGPFTDWLAEASAYSNALHRSIRVEGPDFRMRDMEVLLRFFGFRLRLDKYSGNMKSFLDGTMKELNQRLRSGTMTLNEVNRYLTSCEYAIDATFGIFDDRAFTTLQLAGFERRFNRAVFDVMVYFLSDDRIRQAAFNHKNEIHEAFTDLLDSPEFAASVQTTTKSKTATFGRFKAWGEALSGVLGLDTFATRPVPEPD